MIIQPSEASLDLDLIAIELRARLGLVDNASKICCFFTQRNHRVMPDTRVVLDRLFRCCQEYAEIV